MDRTFEDRQRYWEASRRVRETFARHELANVLHWAFSADEIARMPEEELESFLYGVSQGIQAVEPVWAPAMEGLRGVPAVRADLAKAFAKIRAIARDVAINEITDPMRVTVELYLPPPEQDRDGRPRWRLRGRLADALVWMALKLFSQVPRSLIRPCGITGCTRIYVAAKNQRYCPTHQREAHRLTQRKAEREFRARQRATNTKRKGKKT